MKSLLAAADLRDRLARRRAEGLPALVRCTARANNRAVFSAEIADGARSEPVPAAAVRKLVEAGQLVEVSRRTNVTDYELHPDCQPVTEPIDREPPEEPAMSTDQQKVTLPPIGSTISSGDLAPLLGVSSSRVCQLVKAKTLRGKKEGPKSSRAPWYIDVDGQLLDELEKRGIDYEFEGLEDAGDEAGEVEAQAPPETLAEPSATVSLLGDDDRVDTPGDRSGRSARMIPDDGGDTASGDGVAEEFGIAPVPGAGQTPDPVREISDSESNSPQSTPHYGDPEDRAHPMDELLDEAQYSKDTPLEVLLDEVRTAAIDLVHRTLWGAVTDEARERVRSAVAATEEAMDAARHTLDEAERIAGLNALPAFRTTSVPHDEEA